MSKRDEQITLLELVGYYDTEKVDDLLAEILGILKLNADGKPYSLIPLQQHALRVANSNTKLAR